MPHLARDPGQRRARRRFATSRPLQTVSSNLTQTLAEADTPRSVYLLTESRVVVTYLRLLLLPIRQNLDYDFPLQHSLADPSVVFALAILLGVAAFAVFILVRARKTNRAPGVLVFFGVTWFFATLSVESSVIPIRDVIFEHRVYLPSAGAVVALGTALLWVVESLGSRISLPLQTAVALLITAGPLGVATYARNFVWRDELTLWSDAVAKSPEKARPHGNLAPAYQAKGQLDDAIRECREAIRLDPSMAKAHSNLGVAYQLKGQLDDAILECREAIRLAPLMPEAHKNLGLSLQAKGQLDDAVREYREAIRLAPSMAEAHNDLGGAFHAKGQLADAAREYREAVRLDPSNAVAHTNLGGVLMKQGRAAEAVEERRRALELKPVPEMAFNLATALEAAGRGAEAIAQYQRFLDEAAYKYPDRAEIAMRRIARLRAPPERSAR